MNILDLNQPHYDLRKLPEAKAAPPTINPLANKRLQDGEAKPVATSSKVDNNGAM